jgi:hypothetical protein
VGQIKVTAANFARAETDRMFAAISTDAGGVNRWHHNRVPTPIDHQPVVRQNRDTLYSGAIVDVREGAAFTVPDTGHRYASVMLVNEDHYVQRILHDPGTHHVTADELGTPYILAAARILVDPGDPADVAEVNALQDELGLEAPSAQPFVLPEYDATSFTAVRDDLLERARKLMNFSGAFGRKGEVDPDTHLLGTAAGWGGLPDSEAVYLNVDPGLPVGEYRLVVGDVPVDAFWSISLYNAAGYFEPNARSAYSVNSVTARKEGEGTVVVHFGGCDDDRQNCLPIMEGWNYLVRLYRPRKEILDGSWAFPSIEPLIADAVEGA